VYGLELDWTAACGVHEWVGHIARLPAQLVIIISHVIEYGYPYFIVFDTEVPY